MFVFDVSGAACHGRGDALLIGDVGGLNLVVPGGGAFFSCSAFLDRERVREVRLETG